MINPIFRTTVKPSMRLYRTVLRQVVALMICFGENAIFLSILCFGTPCLLVRTLSTEVSPNRKKLIFILVFKAERLVKNINPKENIKTHNSKHFKFCFARLFAPYKDKNKNDTA